MEPNRLDYAVMEAADQILDRMLRGHLSEWQMTKKKCYKSCATELNLCFYVNDQQADWSEID